eukprot:TRINITY_DN2139_c0_g1_i3.p1 TRINITY_DN2139_c0_g1~~TRINITY_DN2139_c0_g1_i3.p1  ORF type:complete len:427 (-),score=114.96 TRINITY_DN2139_c0_g1_i3:740-2020(-)
MDSEKWVTVLSAPTQLTPEAYWKVLSSWTTNSIYKQIHKIEITQKFYNGVEAKKKEDTPDSEDTTKSVVLDDYKNGQHKKITYKRHIYPTDYTKKKEMTDTVHHDLDINRVEFIPDVEKPEDLPYYYYQAKRFAIQLIPLTEEEKADALKHKVVSNANPPPLLSSENKPDTDTDAVVVEPPHKKVRLNNDQPLSVENISTDGNKTDQASDKVGDANNVVEETKVESMVVVDDNVKTGESAETVITTATKESTETVDAASDAASDVASDIATEESKDSHDSCCMGKSQKKKKRGRARNHKKKLRAQRENDLIDSEKVIDRDGAPFEYRLEFSFVLWDGENYQDTDKLRKICRYYCRFLSKWGNYERKGGYEKRVHHDQIVDRDVFTAHYRRMKEKYKYLNHFFELTMTNTIHMTSHCSLTLSINSPI